jgi:predicted RND superfamily exporter protein
MYNFRKYHAHSGNVYGALKETMLGTGRALLITSLVLCSFFFSVILGTLNNTVIFGLYTGLVIIVALLADFILLPALLAVVSMKQESNVV